MREQPAGTKGTSRRTPRWPGLGVALASPLLGALAGSIVNTAWIFATRPVLRPRTHIEILVLARRAAALAGIELAAWLPPGLGLALDPRRPLQVALFAGHALLAGAAVALPVALAVWLALRPWSAASREVGPTTAASGILLWAPMLAGIAPPLYGPVRGLTPATSRIENLNAILWLLLGLALAGALAAAARRGRLTLRAVRVGGGLALAAALAGLLLHSAVLGRGPACDFAGACPDAAGRPDILLVSIDSLRPDHLGCYGYPRDTSPALDRLAREGARFATVVAPSTWTLPSHLSLLTGMAVEERENDILSLRADLDIETLAEALRQAGYATAAFVGGPYLGSRYGYAQGFDVYDDTTVVATSNPGSHQGVTSPELLRQVQKWLDGHRADGNGQPSFIFLHLWDVHYDYIPPPPYDSMFDPDYQGAVTGRDFYHGDQVHAGMDPRDLEHVVALYDGEIAWTDSHLERLLDRLRDDGTLDDTIVAVTADHGDEFFEHGSKGHRENLFDTTLLAPLVMRYPAAILPGTVVPDQVRLMDVAPTLLSLAGLEPGVRGDPRRGLDLVPLLDPARTGPPMHRTAFADLLGQQAAVRTGSRKLILRPASGRASLYDLKADPGERHDLAEQQPGRVQELTDLVAAWREELDLGGFSGPLPADAAHQKRLRSLGYVD